MYVGGGEIVETANTVMQGKLGSDSAGSLMGSLPLRLLLRVTHV